MTKKTYKITRGYVLGKLWGGGEGAYPCKKIEAKTKKELMKEAERMLDDGSLDRGMGYQSLIGAIFDIQETETIIKDRKEYYYNEYEIEMIGDLNEKQQDFLQDILLNN